jgi:hypothetical protein
MTEEIIAYRLGESLFCLDCYEKTAKILKGVQNPEDPQVTIPAKPITKNDTHIFACNQCGVVKGSIQKRSETSAEERSATLSLSSQKKIEPRRKTLSRRESIDLLTLQDIIEDCGTKLSFLSDFLVQGPVDCEPEITYQGASGFSMILDEIKDDLDFVVNEMSERTRKGLIIEKRE